MKLRKGEFEVFFKTHAVFRAEEREIPWDLIESTIKTGKFERYGKDRVKIWKKFRKGRLVCVGQICSRKRVKIVTITFG